MIPIDTDFQDPPELIFDMIKYWQEGYDIVYAKRKVREGETLMRLFSTSMFYKIIGKMAHVIRIAKTSRKN